MLAVATVACVSPTDFDVMTDVEIRVEDAIATKRSSGSVYAPLSVEISNRGSLAVTYSVNCYVGSLLREGVPLFSFSPLCAEARAVEIAPGESSHVALEIRASAGEWGDQVDGDYELLLHVFVEGRSRSEPALSGEFRIAIAP